jgi:hypothetical protein
VLCLALFGGMCAVLQSAGPTNPLDQGLDIWLRSFCTSLLDELMIFATYLCSWQVIVSGAVLAEVWFFTASTADRGRCTASISAGQSSHCLLSQARYAPGPARSVDGACACRGPVISERARLFCLCLLWLHRSAGAEDLATTRDQVNHRGRRGAAHFDSSDISRLRRSSLAVRRARKHPFGARLAECHQHRADCFR